MRTLIERLHREQNLAPDELRTLLTECSPQDLDLIHEKARSVSHAHFGNRIYIRGLIEIGNCCRNDCFYCGIRRSNPHITRYRLDEETILTCCTEGYDLGFRTFVLQGGEDNYMTDDRVTSLVSAIRKKFPDVAITLSLGERATQSYEQFFKAGANRYLLRHETHNPAHYRTLHPRPLSIANRLRCLDDLKKLASKPEQALW